MKNENNQETPDNDPAWDERAPELTEAGRNALAAAYEPRRHANPENERE